jgi:hypothetical protein
MAAGDNHKIKTNQVILHFGKHTSTVCTHTQTRILSHMLSHAISNYQCTRKWMATEDIYIYMNEK